MYTYTFIYKLPAEFSYMGKTQMALVDVLVDKDEYNNHLDISILASHPRTLQYRQYIDWRKVIADLRRQALLAVMREQNISQENEVVATFH